MQQLLASLPSHLFQTIASEKNEEIRFRVDRARLTEAIQWYTNNSVMLELVTALPTLDLAPDLENPEAAVNQYIMRTIYSAYHVLELRVQHVVQMHGQNNNKRAK